MSIYIPTDRLSTEGLSISIEDNLLITDIDLYVSEAEMIYLYAPKISWAQSLLKSFYISALRKSGELKINNQFIKSSGLTNELRQSIGFVVEENPLFFDWTVKENLIFVADHSNVNGAKKTLENLISRFGVESILDHTVSQLEPDLVTILMYIRASIHNPSLILCDQSITTMKDANLDLLMGHLTERIKSEKVSAIFTIDSKERLAKYPARVYQVAVDGVKNL